MKYELFVSDFDGTLGNAPDEINPETLAAVKKYVEKGGKFVICTGRMYSSVKKICLKYGLGGTVVSFQGAMINNLSDGKTILEGGIDYVLAEKVASELLKEKVPTVVDIDDVLYCEEYTPYTDYHKGLCNIQLVPSILKVVEQFKKPVHKIVSVGNPERIKELTEKYSAIYKNQLIFNSGGDVILEVINPEFSKGKAIRYLSKYFSIPYDKIIAVGDSTNDIEMINGPWHGVAVGDAKEELKKYADEITVPYSEKPVKVLLEKYCL